MNSNDEQLCSIVQSAIEIASPGRRKEFLDKSCVGRPGLRTRLQAIMDALPEDAAQDNNAVHGSEDSVLRSIAPERPPSIVVLDDSLHPEAEPVVQPNSVEIPKTIESSRFQLQGEIARGGMGAVIKGRDVDLGRNLAIKVLLDQHKQKPHVIQRFIEEAQIGGQLQHPGIAPVYELGQFEDGRPFFTMKLVKGDTLAYMLAVRPSLDHDRSKLLGIFEQVCQTMAYAHSRRVIHRDLKPANIMVGAFGEVQVMDWGLAKVLPEEGQAVSRSTRPDATDGKSVIATLRSGGIEAPEAIGSAGSTPSETQMGSALGTPAYMPPEQALGEVDQMDRRSDVFGLGAILCEILTGKPPYVAEDTAALMRLVSRGNTDECFARLEQCGADEQLVQLAKDCLAFELSHRPTSAAVVSKRVTGYLESVEQQIKETEIRRAEEEAKTVEERKRLRVTLALAASVLLTLAIGSGGWMWNQQQTARRRQAASQEFDAAVNQAKLHHSRAESSDLNHRQGELELALQNTKTALSVSANRYVSEEKIRIGQELEAQLVSDLKATKQDLADRQRNDRLRQQLELIRVSDLGERDNVMVGVTSPSFDTESTDQAYRQAFSQAGIDFDNQTDQQLLDLIAASAIGDSLIGAIDHWLRTIPEAALGRRIQARYSIGDWMTAAKIGREHLEADPSKAVRWLQLAPALILSGQEAEYVALCEEMHRGFTASDQALDSERLNKVCTLLPDTIHLSSVPSKVFEQSLDQDRLAKPVRPYAWSSRALLEYRRGNIDLAAECLDRARDAEPDSNAHALILAVQALSDHASDDRQGALQTLDKLRNSIEVLLEDPVRRGWHDTAIAIILLREVESKLGTSNPDSRITQFAADGLGEAELPRVEQRAQLRSRLMRLVEQSDSNEWRKQVRDAITRNNSEQLDLLASDEKTSQQAPGIVASLGEALRKLSSLDSAIEVVQRSQLRYPADFWLNCELAKCYRENGNAVETLNFARTAFAVAPENPAAHWLLITCLSDAEFVGEAESQLNRMLEKSDLSSPELARLGLQLSTYGRHHLAEMVIRKSIDLAPNEGLGYQTLARTLGMAGNIDAAIDAAKRSVECDRSDPLSYALLGVSLRKQGQLDEAVRALKQAIELAPTNSGLQFALAELFLEVDQAENAEPALRRVLEIDPRHQPARQQLVKLLRMKQDAEQATAKGTAFGEILTLVLGQAKKSPNKLREEIKRSPGSVSLRYELAKLHFERREFAVALSELNDLLRRTRGHASAHWLRGRILRQQGELDESIAEFRTALGLDPENYAKLFRLAFALHEKAVGSADSNSQVTEPELLSEAIDLYRKVHRINATHPGARRALIDALELRGDDQEAATMRDSFARMAPEEKISQLLSEARFMTAEQRTSEAISVAEELLEIDPKHVAGLTLKISLLVADGQLRRALPDARKLAETAPAMALATVFVGELEIRNGHFEQGIETLRLLTEKNIDLAAAHAANAFALLQLNKRHEAIDVCQQAIAADPANWETHNALAYCLAYHPMDQQADNSALDKALEHALIAANATEHLPAQLDPLHTLGIVYCRRGEWQKARDFLEMAHQRKFWPNQFDGVFLAMTYHHLGQHQQAAEWYRHAWKVFETRETVLPTEKLIFAEAEKLFAGKGEHD